MTPFRPKGVVQGTRAVSRRAGQHKHKPKVARGAYVKAPLLRDKVTSPRWQANAVVNNPGNFLAGTAIAGGAGIAIPHKKVEKRDKRVDNTAAGALIGGGAGHFARTGADYGAKAVAERQFKPLTTKGNYGPYTESEHKPVLNKYKRVAQKEGGSSVRSKAKYFDEHFPKGVPSARARQIGVALNKKPAIAAAVLGTAAVGAGVGATRKVKKNMTTSAFGVDHGEISKLDYGSTTPSRGRKNTAMAFGSLHGAVAGRKGKKLRAAGNEGVGTFLGTAAGQIAGGTATALATRNPGAIHGGALAGGLVGGAYGASRGLARNQRKGYLKPETA